MKKEQNIIKQTTEAPLAIKDLEDPNIFYQVYNAESVPGMQYDMLRAGEHIDDHYAKCISSKFRNNSMPIASRTLGRGRPVSANYILNPNDGKYYVVWGGFEANGEAKLHEHIVCSQIYNDLKNIPGIIIRSGHMGSVVFIQYSVPIRIALFDSFCSEKHPEPHPEELPIITTLFNNNILPVTTDGYPIKFGKIAHLNVKK